ncbi:5-oxoprolinase subunit B family protein [Hyphomonas johnsonii]|uniref:Allophanate hydrolase subunit 1 n=1 Tax=Hyphomonas johnsonii MHS-2 TaxID=1280950 RepID=A0A059FVP9_9PROT|nr:carboxyltransferase domain-containing protein [Hyphomonas johnsonii]KCZ94682.1 allophanate hydrolase subunit 1 [Hyphomonas johnsonii MHS-2]
MNEPDILFSGDDALRVLLSDRATRIARASQLRQSGDWLEVVPGRQDVTVQFDPIRLTPAEAMAHLRLTLATPPPPTRHATRTIDIPVRFGGSDGPDLAMIAESLGVTEPDIVSQLLAQPLRVDMLGFTPGFAYMTGLEEHYVIPRLLQPRQQVPAGSIGLITGQCGLYALAGPGGWPIIGRALASLFDPASADPFILQPGLQVRLVDSSKA